MILVDTSVVIQYLRRTDPTLAGRIAARPVAICGVTIAEVLAGGRSPADIARFTAILAGFLQVSVPLDVWPDVCENLATLYGSGLSIPFADVTIATVAIAHGVELWARDRHFPWIAAHLPGLRLFAETPGGGLP